MFAALELPSLWSSPAKESSHSTRLYEEYVPSRPDGPDFHGEAAVDIIAVHGLAGKRSTSWSVVSDDATEPGRYHWLRSKLPRDLPAARILTFEYASEWYDNPSHVDLEECGAQLLRCIAQDRRHPGELLACPVRRPIIFLGHSFGGLVVKQALIYASQTHAWGSTTLQKSDFRNHRDILASTAGILFLGTPHRGSNFSQLARAKMFVGSMLGHSTNPDLVGLLALDGVLLRYVRHQFGRLLAAEILRNIHVYCYFEQEEMRPLPMVVVDETSACIEGAPRRGLPLNHKQLNKFGPGLDRDYNVLLADIKAVLRDCRDIVPPRFQAWQYDADGCDPVREGLRRALNPSREEQSRELDKRFAIQQTASYTCRWIHRLPAFQSWTQWPRRQNVLWINGKAGSGKSIMAAYLTKTLGRGGLDDDATVRRAIETSVCTVPLTLAPCGHQDLDLDLTVLHFFCGIERTLEEPASFIGTLIHQLLAQHNENQRLVSIAQRVYKDSPDGVEPSTMVRLLADLIEVAGRATIIVDGLEEALGVVGGQEAYRHFIRLLSFANGNPRVRLLIFSQGVADIHQELLRNFDYPAIVCITDHTQPDIDRFVELEVADLVQQNPRLHAKRDEIVQKLRVGSQGMFQWVSASIGHLKKDVRDPADVAQCLDDLPKGLSSTYGRMFLRIESMSDFMQLRVKVALRWLAVPARPLTSLELKVAVMLGDDPDDHANLQEVASFIRKQSHDYSEYAREFRSLLEDLVQIDHSGDVPTIQLAHPSLRKTLSSEPNPSKDGAMGPYKFSLERAHKECSLACIQLIRHSTFSHTNAFDVSEAPLVEYAWEFWAYHFKQSSSSLANERLRKAFDMMILQTTHDAIAFLGALTDFVSSPLEPVAGVDNQLSYIVSLQHAQESILPSMKALEAVRDQAPLSSDLVESKELVGRAAYSATPTTRAHELVSWMRRKGTQLRIRHLRTQSAVMSLRSDDHLARNVQLQSSIRPANRTLWEAARKLRVVALRFAVNPVYGALIAKAGGPSFSPIHFLVYVAGLLEECGDYPYWEELPPPANIMEPFLCGPKDPFAGAARFVLHSFEYRYPAAQGSAETAPRSSPESPRRTRSRSLSPRPDPRHVGAYQTISASDRKRAQALQEMPGHRYVAATYAHQLFRSDEGDWLRLLVNPLKHLHMKKVLHLRRGGIIGYHEDPRIRLARHAPRSLQSSPLQSYIRALPAMMRLSFARFFAHIMEIFLRFGKFALAQHYSRFEQAKEEFKGVVQHCNRLRDPRDTVKWWHLGPALLLFLVRSRYFAQLGNHYSPHPWREFLYCFKHPAAYLDWQQQAMSFWRWCLWGLNILFVRTVTVSSLTAGVTLPAGGLRDALNIAGSFFLVVQLERAVFSMCFIAATLAASARVIFMDEESTRSVANFTLLYWINTFVGVCFGCASILTSPNATKQAKWWYVILWLCAQCLITVGWIVYQHQLWRLLSRVFMATLYHLTWPVWVMVRTALRVYVPALKLMGIVAFVYAGFLALHLMSRWVRDPYDTQSSYAGLDDARRIARRTVQAAERKRIGVFPLGDGYEDSAFRLSVRAPTLEHEAMAAAAAAAAAAADGSPAPLPLQVLGRATDDGSPAPLPLQAPDRATDDGSPAPSPLQAFGRATDAEIFNLVLGAESIPRAAARPRNTSPHNELDARVWDELCADQLATRQRNRRRSDAAEKKRQ